MPQPVLYLVRHGISEWNLLKKWQGQVDTNLAPIGTEQAKERGKIFNDNGVYFDQAYTSDLKRASQTCQVLMSTCGDEQSVHADERLRECSLGEFEGMHKSDIYGEKYAELWSYLGSLSHEARIRTPYFEGLETPLDVGTRAGQCLLEALMASEVGDDPDTLLAVTHSTVIESLLASLFGADFDSIHTDNLCWIRFKLDQSRLVMDGSDGVSYKVSPDALPISPSCMTSFQHSSEEAMRQVGDLDLCEGNFRVSSHVGEFFNTAGSLLIALSGLHTALQFQFKQPMMGLITHRQRTSQMLSLGIAAVGSSLAYAHFTLDSAYMHLSLALTLCTSLFAVFTSSKDTPPGTEVFRTLTLLTVLYGMAWKSGPNQQLVLWLALSAILVVYVARMATLLRKTKDPRNSIAFIQGMVALVGGSLLLCLDPHMCARFGQVITMRALGYCLLSGAAQLILACFIEQSVLRAWLRPSLLFNIWIPVLTTWQEEHISQK